MSAKFENVTILLPAMDETYSLRETVDTIVRTCDTKDLAEFILLLCDRTSSESELSQISLLMSIAVRFLSIFMIRSFRLLEELLEKDLILRKDRM